MILVGKHLCCNTKNHCSYLGLRLCKEGGTSFHAWLCCQGIEWIQALCAQLPPKPATLVHSPTYVAIKQYATNPDNSLIHDAIGKKFIKNDNSKFLYQGLVIVSKLLTPISSITSQQATSTEEAMKKAKKDLNMWQPWCQRPDTYGSWRYPSSLNCFSNNSYEIKPAWDKPYIPLCIST